MFAKMLPDYKVNSFKQITPAWLADQKKTALLTDLDNTLVARLIDEPTPELKIWIQELLEGGIKVLLLSNNKKQERVRYFGEKLGIPYLHDVSKPSTKGFTQAFTRLSCSAQDCIMLGDQLSTDILGGNRAGVTTILTSVQSGGDLLQTRLLRWLERRFLSLVKLFGGNKKKLFTFSLF